MRRARRTSGLLLEAGLRLRVGPGLWGQTLQPGSLAQCPVGGWLTHSGPRLLVCQLGIKVALASQGCCEAGMHSKGPLHRGLDEQDQLYQ